MAGGRRRAGVACATYSGQGGYPGGVPRGPRRIVRRPRDLEQLLDVLSGGAADDPEEFLSLLSAAPRLMGRRAAPPPPPSPPELAAADAYRRQLQQQQQQLEQQAAAAAEAQAARRRAFLQQQQQMEEEEEERQRQERIRAAMLQKARRHLPHYDPQSLARLAAGLADAGVTDPALCDAMLRQMVAQQQQQQGARQAQQQAEAAAAQQQQQQQQQRAQGRQALPEYRSLADLLDAFAAMRHRPTDAQLAEALRLQQQQQQQQQQQLQQQQQQLQQQRRAEPPPPPPPAPQAPASQWSAPRLQPRGMGASEVPTRTPPPPPPPPPPSATPPAAATAAGMSPDDAARLLYALSRLGYQPDDATVAQLLERLQPQLRAKSPSLSSSLSSSSSAAAAAAAPVRSQQVQPAAGQLPTAAVAAAEAAEEEEEGYGEEESEEEDDEEQEEAALSRGLQAEAQAVANAVRALERMGRPTQAAQLRQRFLRSVEEARARAAARRAERAEQRRQRQAAAAAAAAAKERERLQREQQQQLWARQQREAAAAAAAAAAAEQERQQREAEQRQLEAAERQRREREEAEARRAEALRAQLARRLRTADEWQTIRALLFAYQDAADPACLLAAATRLAELLSAGPGAGPGPGRRGPRAAPALGLRDRAELGDLMEGLGQLVLRALPYATGPQAAGLLVAVLGVRHLEQGLVVGLLRRLREALGEVGPAELAGVLGALAECGLRPSGPWMEAFLARCEDQLEAFEPQHLASLPLWLARLGAHPGRSWLGSYLDVVQARESELSQEAVSATVRSVASLDRQFLAAWRQAATVRQQMEAQAAARAKAAAAAQHQQQQQAQVSQPADQASGALASADEALLEPDSPGEAYDSLAGVQLPPMHPEQAKMAAQGAAGQGQGAVSAAAPQVPRREAEASLGGAAAAAAAAAAGARSPPMQSIELDVDGDDLPYSRDGAAAATGPAEAAEAAEAAAATAPSAPYESRQLPGSYSADGYYNPGPYGSVYDSNGGEGEGEGEEEEGQGEGQEEVYDGEGLVLDESVAETVAEASHAGGGGGGPKQVEVEAVEAEVVEPEQRSVPTTETAAAPPPPPSREPAEAAAAKPSSASSPKPAPSPEDLARGRALRSLLLERYEAVAAYKEDVEKRQQRAAAAGNGSGEDGEEGGQGVAMSAELKAAAARFKAAKMQLEKLQADFANVKRRAELERAQVTAQAKADVLKPLLGIADNFERARSQIKPKTDGERAVHEAYQAVYAEIQQFLRQQGLEEVGAEGEAFDPNLHDAIGSEERDDVDDGTVTAVFQKGYRLGELLIRPALVRVASR